MASVSGVSTVSKIFTKLGDYKTSVVPMYVKDTTSAALTSMTYFKDGGEHDGAEKALEEFGTGILWLGGIPFFKKVLFDEGIFKKKNIDPNIDPKRLFSGENKNLADTVEFAKEKAKSLGENFSEQAEILENTIKNKKLAKNLNIAKFGVSTALTGLALFALIDFKQKRTEKQIEGKLREKYAKEAVLANTVKENETYKIFNNTKENKNNNPSFKGMATFFMSNPIANTALVDTVITGTRLAQARKGERFEVGLREACTLAFIYGLAQPLQKGFEIISNKVFKRPTELNFAALDSVTIKNALNSEKAQEGSSSLLKQAKKVLELAGENKKISNDNTKKIIDFVFDEKNSEFADILKRTGDVGTFKTKEGVEQLSLLSGINPKDIKKTAQDTINFIEGGAKHSGFSQYVKKGLDGASADKYLKQAKVLKGASIVGNIAVSAFLLGYVQPKLNLFLRKKFNNGDNTNPAIRNLEAQIKNKLAFEGNKENNQ